MNCDLCDSDKFTPLDVAKPYIGNQEPPVVCSDCGFVYVRERRSQEEVAKAWDEIWGEGYSSNWPAVKARLYYVSEWLDQTLGLEGKSVLDIGAGEGLFLKFVKERGAHPVGLEPFRENVLKIRSMDIACFHGTAESVEAGQYDIVTLNWTLENCSDCVGLLKRARQFCKPDGYVCVSTGSRILVPYKKPISSYFSKNPQDTHCFRFSHNSLCSALAKSGFSVTNRNYWTECDWLVCAATPGEMLSAVDSPEQVRGFFQTWASLWP